VVRRNGKAFIPPEGRRQPRPHHGD
jgi:hypothetical protein